MPFEPIFGLSCPNCNHNTDNKPALKGTDDQIVYCPVCNHTITLINTDIITRVYEIYN